MNKGIRISEKHGVNPAIPKCFFCGEDKNMIILAGRLKGDVEAPRNAVWDKEPCDKCKEWMAMGVMFVSVKDGSDQNNPYRTGKMCVIKEEAAKNIFNNLGNSRFAFIEDAAWSMIGLPTQNVGVTK